MTAEQETFGFDPQRWYRPKDEALRKFASPDQLAQWRVQGIGLPWHKIGSKVFYFGGDLIRFLHEERRVPQAKPRRRKRVDDAHQDEHAAA